MRFALIFLCALSMGQTVPAQLSGLSTSTDNLHPMAIPQIPLPGASYVDTYHPNGAGSVNITRLPSLPSNCPVRAWTSGLTGPVEFPMAYGGRYYYVPASVRGMPYTQSKATNAATAAGNNVLHFATTAIPANYIGGFRSDFGYTVTGTNIPANTTVTSFDATSVTLSANVTGSGIASGASITFTTLPTQPPWVEITQAQACEYASSVVSYSARQSFNADGSRFMVIARTLLNTAAFYRTNPLSFEKFLSGTQYAALTGTNGSETWDKTDPDVIYFQRASYADTTKTFTSLNVATGALTAVYTFTINDTDGDCPSGTTTIQNGGAGNPSADQRYWPFFCSDGSSYKRLIVYDKTLNRVTSKRDVVAICGVPRTIDIMTMSPSGLYVMVSWSYRTLSEDVWATCSGAEAFDRTTLESRGMVFTYPSGHLDVGYDAAGREVAVSTFNGHKRTATDNYPGNRISATAFADVHPPPYDWKNSYVKAWQIPCTALYVQQTSDPFFGCKWGTGTPGGMTSHVSGRGAQDPAHGGWFLVSTITDGGALNGEGSGWGKAENLAFYIDTSQPNTVPDRKAVFRRVSRDFSSRYHVDTPSCTASGDYWQEAHTTVNRDFTKLLFSGSWLQQCGAQKVYLLDLAKAPVALNGCPTSTDDKGEAWPNTCFVANDGSDATGTGAWTAPFKTVSAAYAAVTANNGASIVLRRGRYANNTLDGLYQPASKCSEASPCTIRSYAGEVVIVDGSSWTADQGWFHSSLAAQGDTPPWSGDTKAGYIHVSGIRFENFPAPIVWGQGDTDGMEFRSVRIHSPGGFNFQKCTRCAIYGSQVTLSGWGRKSGGQNAGLVCGGVTPSAGSIPWPVSSTNGQTPYWDLVHTAPTTTSESPNGCVDLRVQDSVFTKRNMSSSSVIGMEASTRVLMERVKLHAPWTRRNNEGWALWGTAATDSADLKGTAFLGRDVEIRGGNAGLRLGHSSSLDRALILGSFETEAAGLTGMTFLNQGAASGYEWPSPVNYRTVRYAFNDPLTNDAVVVLSRTDSGLGIAVDLPVTFAGVPGCTGINGGKLVKRIYQGTGHANTFAIKNMDGSRFTCPDAYDLTQHAFQTLDPVPVTFTPASTNVTAAGLAAAVYAQDRIRFTTTGTLPPELTANVDYWLVYRLGATVQLSATRGGTPVTFSSAGSGLHTAVVTDERTSYAGRMSLQPYVQSVNHLSALSRNGSAVNLGDRYSGPTPSATWKIDNSVAASFDGTQAVTHTMFLTALPRVVMAEASPNMAVEYFDDAGTLRVGTRVYFRESCKLPAGLEKDTPYYIVAADAETKTIQVSETPGGAAITPTGLCSQPYYWLYTPGFTSTRVSLGNSLLAAGDTVTLMTDDGATPVHPLVKGNTYYVDSVSSGEAGGVPFRWATIKNAMSDPAPISFSQYPMYPDSYFEKVVHTGGVGVPAFQVSAYTTNAPSTNNWYWSSQADRAFCALTIAHGGTDAGGSCAADQTALDTQQAGSKLAGGNPALDYQGRGRASASTPAELWNRGYYAGTSTVEAGSTGMVLRWRAPEAGDHCTAWAYSDAGLTTPVETMNSPSGNRWRSVMARSLSPATNYWYKVQCESDVVTGTLVTLASSSGTGTLGLKLASAAGATSAALDTSADGNTWVPGIASSCASGCALASAALPANAAVWYRWRRLDGNGATLQQSEPQAVVVR
ncbi:hypothetical protein [Paludibaculum fermentans]|uniref:DUF1565 domain-containing protein n=1 Tax=Paludibaculum fermentans TaxID=1473598 RepID=A0A7S7NZW0_PALFE|nr:hypothetical protein [Paludibaculum fermentans]QOY92339.1 hypothetical protein IRI77_37745 [Paludibaculum fermentans]